MIMLVCKYMCIQFCIQLASQLAISCNIFQPYVHFTHLYHGKSKQWPAWCLTFTRYPSPLCSQHITIYWEAKLQSYNQCIQGTVSNLVISELQKEVLHRPPIQLQWITSSSLIVPIYRVCLVRSFRWENSADSEISIYGSQTVMYGTPYHHGIVYACTNSRYQTTFLPHGLNTRLVFYVYSNQHLVHSH